MCVCLFLYFLNEVFCVEYICSVTAAVIGLSCCTECDVVDIADWLHNLRGREEMESLALKKQLLSWRVARLKQRVNAVMSQYSVLDRSYRDSFLYL